MTPEQIKLHHETYKHLTTLSAGAIVLISALFRTDLYSVRLAGIVVVGSLIASVLVSTFMMIEFARGDVPNWLNLLGSRGTLFLWAFALGGLFVLGLKV